MRKPWPFVVCLLGMALTSAVLILLMPSLIDSASNRVVWLAGLMGCLACACAVGARHWKPPMGAEDP